MIMVCLGFCSSTKGMYLSAITQALDMDRSSFSINSSVRYVATVASMLAMNTAARLNKEENQQGDV